MKHVMLLLPPRNPDRKNWPGGGGRAAEEAEVKNKKEGTRAREGRDELGLVKYGSANKREASGRAERDAQADDIPNLLHSSLFVAASRFSYLKGENLWLFLAV